MEYKPPQKSRILILIFYIVLVFYANYIVFGQWLPLTSGKGLWFYAGLASLLLGNYLVTPFFTKPVDAISYSVFSIIALFSLSNTELWSSFEYTLFYLTIIFLAIILSSSFLQIITKDSGNTLIQKWSNTFRILSERLGDQKIIFSSIILFSLVVFHRTNPFEFFVLTLVWAIVVVLRPDQFIINTFISLKNVWIEKTNKSIVGDIAALQTPKLVLIKPNKYFSLKKNSYLITKNSDTYPKLAIPLNYVGWDDTRLLRAYEFDVPKSLKLEVGKIAASIPLNKVVEYENNSIDELLINETILLHNTEKIVGIVSEDTSISKLYFEVINEEEIEEGNVIAVNIRNNEVLYQIIDGITKEEIIYQKNKYGFARATAKKIGIWDKVNKKFKDSKWIPNINSPVFLLNNQEFIQTIDSVGHFPATNYSVSIKSINDLVTHNTAILGILGIGKSMLSIELIERMMAKNIKVICLDLTNQYATELAEYYNSKEEDKRIKKIILAGEKDKENWADNPEEGGSIPNLTKAIYDDLNDFIKNNTNEYLKIYNPAQLFATKQLSDPKQFKVGSEWKRNASLWAITPVEVTSIVSEITLEILSDEMRDEAKVCLVFEEAHSLVPEFNNVANDRDKSATAASARAILQGRKYGLGCLLITQRTANVTKTILNQCNTIFAMRTFDDTGMGFLSNYIGRDYSSILPNLKEREAVFFGKASSCENPVHIRLNDRNNFIDVFRGEYPPPEFTVIEEIKEELQSEDEQIKDNDLPF